MVLVTIDTLAADRVGAYGCPSVRTPNLDRWARQGIQVIDAISPAPLTAPSHATILTGIDPPRHGVRDNAMFVLSDSVVTFHELLPPDTKTAAFVGAFPLSSRFGFSQGFDVFNQEFVRGNRSRPPERTADAVLEPARQWLESAESGSRPFVWLHLFDAHYPHESPKPWEHAALALPGATSYDGEVAWIDAELGRFFAGLRAGRHPLPTICIVADHGESLGAHGEITHALFIYDATQRVPMILAGPRIAPRLETGMRRLSDVAATMLACWGDEKIEASHGVPLQEPAEIDVAYLETKHTELMRGWAPLHGIRTPRWKYIRAPRSELYDLAADPGETRDVCKEHADVVETLSRQLDEALTHAAGADPTPLNSEDEERLRSLGYVAAIADPAEADVRKDPKDGAAGAAALFWGSEAYSRGNLVLAESHLLQAIALDPSCKEAYSFLSGTYLGLGRPALAVDYARRSLEMTPHLNEATVHGALGEALLQLGRAGEAIPHLEEGRRARPHDTRLAELLTQAEQAAR